VPLAPSTNSEQTHLSYLFSDNREPVDGTAVGPGSWPYGTLTSICLGKHHGVGVGGVDFLFVTTGVQKNDEEVLG
jgi:hypothetical protein